VQSAISAWDSNTCYQAAFGKTNSIPYFAPTVISFCISPYGTSAGGGNVMAGKLRRYRHYGLERARAKRGRSHSANP
ncbi:MAG TPA: hypothetical protein VGU64_06070, partial [Terriglobales bacterium]|nr:hypothetical protein [Terriglobales bacterium]